MFTIYPAIDLKDGACVRLRRGDLSDVTIYGHDPAAMARRFAAAGFLALHVVDLDGAVAGRPVNEPAVAAILRAVPEMAVQLGGGVRDPERADAWFAAGVTRLVLGSAAIANPGILARCAALYPGRIVAAVDQRADGTAATHGWTRGSGINAASVARTLADAGAAAVIHTSIARDGTLEGPDVETVRSLAAALPVPVIASGGVASRADIAALEKAGAGGVIVGRAFYEGVIELN